MKSGKRCGYCEQPIAKHSAGQIECCKRWLAHSHRQPIENDPEVLTTLYLRSVPLQLKRKFKMKCAEEDVTMTGKMLELMRSAVEV